MALSVFLSLIVMLVFSSAFIGAQYINTTAEGIKSAKIFLDKNSYAPGSVASVKIIDLDFNADPDIREVIYLRTIVMGKPIVEITIVQPTKGTLNISALDGSMKDINGDPVKQAIETGPNTGIFEFKVKLPDDMEENSSVTVSYNDPYDYTLNPGDLPTFYGQIDCRYDKLDADEPTYVFRVDCLDLNQGFYHISLTVEVRSTYSIQEVKFTPIDKKISFVFNENDRKPLIKYGDKEEAVFQLAIPRGLLCGMFVIMADGKPNYPVDLGSMTSLTHVTLGYQYEGFVRNIEIVGEEKIPKCGEQDAPQYPRKFSDGRLQITLLVGNIIESDPLQYKVSLMVDNISQNQETIILDATDFYVQDDLGNRYYPLDEPGTSEFFAKPFYREGEVTNYPLTLDPGGSIAGQLTFVIESNDRNLTLHYDDDITSMVVPEFPFVIIIASVATGVMIGMMRFRKFNKGKLTTN